MENVLGKSQVRVFAPLYGPEMTDEHEEPDADHDEAISAGTDLSLDSYMKEISRIPVLSHGQTVALFQALEDKRERLDSLNQCQASVQEREKRRSRLEREITRIQEQLVTSNLRLVVYVANKYNGLGISIQDLIQEGNIGLIRAIDKFDHRLGYRFSTYAVWWIRQGMLKAIHQQGRMIRIPTHVWEKLKRNGFHPPAGREEGGKEGDGPADDPLEMVQAVELMRTPLSLDTSLAEDGLELQEVMGDENEPAPDAQAIARDLRAKLRMALTTLPIREEMILRLRYGIDLPATHTLEEVGQLFQLTKERIRQIESKALRRLNLT